MEKKQEEGDLHLLAISVELASAFFFPLKIKVIYSHYQGNKKGMNRTVSCAVIILLACTVVVSVAKSDDNKGTNAPEAVTAEDVESMTLKELRTQLRMRNLVCATCVEKYHFVDFLKEHLAESPVVVDRSTVEDEQQQKKKKREKVRKPNPQTPDGAKEPPKKGARPPQEGNIDLEELKKELRKKRNENIRLREAMKKAGLDTSKMKDDTDGLDAFLNERGKAEDKEL